MYFMEIRIHFKAIKKTLVKIAENAILFLLSKNNLLTNNDEEVNISDFPHFNV